MFQQVDEVVYIPPNSKHVLSTSQSAMLLVFEFDLQKLLPTTPTYDFNIHVGFDHLLNVKA
jgi:hypothetical protein